MTCQNQIVDVLRASLDDEDLLECFSEGHQRIIRRLRSHAVANVNCHSVINTLTNHFAAAIEKDLYLKYVLTEAPTGVPS